MAVSVLRQEDGRCTKDCSEGIDAHNISQKAFRSNTVNLRERDKIGYPKDEYLESLKLLLYKKAPVMHSNFCSASFVKGVRLIFNV